MICELPPNYLSCPFRMLRLCWPDVTLFDDQALVLESLARGNKITLVPAGNMVGKDFVAAYAALWFFCSRTPARVLTSSVDYSQLEGVLWGEIRRWIDSSRYPLGIRVKELHIRQVRKDGTLHPLSELIGRVAQSGVTEGMLGRHVARGPNNAPRALGIIDEASGFEDTHKNALETWCHLILAIGNCYPCENFFKEGCKVGDIPNPHDPDHLYQRVIRIPAARSPNVRLALAEKAAGLPISHTEVIPGCISYAEYTYRRDQWDIKRQTIGLDAEWYSGAEVMLYPEEWLTLSVAMAEALDASEIIREAVSMGVDVGEGGDPTCWTIIDKWGIIFQRAKKTEDTTVIYKDTIALMEQYGVRPENVVFDLGGGGKAQVDSLNEAGYPVRGVAFGSAPTADTRSKEATAKKDGAFSKGANSKGAYKNRRAEMYGLLRNLLNPHAHSQKAKKEEAQGINMDRPVFAIPGKYKELLRQLGPVPLEYDSEGRIMLPPKTKPHKGYRGQTIEQLLGHSPDESDSTVLAVYGMTYPVTTTTMTVF